MDDIGRIVKFRRVFKRKLLKPILKAIGVSFLLYLLISSAVLKRNVNSIKPHFVISTISTSFNDIEYTHLLLSIQEISKNKKDREALIEFANSKYPNMCSDNLKELLYEMNWEPLAFLSRVKKLFELASVYERYKTLNLSIDFIEHRGYEEDVFRKEYINHVIFLRKESNRIKESLSVEEFEFVNKYYGTIMSLKKI